MLPLFLNDLLNALQQPVGGENGLGDRKVLMFKK